ncbi:MAG: SgcJ/EcaC family oxidoreductase [Blastocatellia bacterium]|nr:SgcJ/EcaC family oxidoreductase [Blastocatellia bacterium]
MRILLSTVISLVFVVGVFAQTPNREGQVRRAVQSFYAAFNSHGFEHAAEYTTEDWNHINPFGGRTRGRDATLKDLKEVHATFLKGVTDTIEKMEVRFATRDVAVVTVTSRMTTYITPDGVRHENERHIRTFVVVKRSGRWLIMQDQNTIMGRGGGSAALVPGTHVECRSLDDDNLL